MTVLGLAIPILEDHCAGNLVSVLGVPCVDDLLPTCS